VSADDLGIGLNAVLSSSLSSSLQSMQDKAATYIVVNSGILCTNW
jgi:hypothetical protein